MSYVTNTFLLASSSVRSKQLLCFVQGLGQKSEQKHITKNFAGFRNHSPIFTMISRIKLFQFSLTFLENVNFSMTLKNFFPDYPERLYWGIWLYRRLLSYYRLFKTGRFYLYNTAIIVLQKISLVKSLKLDKQSNATNSVFHAFALAHRFVILLIF